MAQTAGRSLQLLSLLQTANRWSGPELAARLGVSLRTLRRDVDTLRELGYPVHASGGRDSTYALGAGTNLPPLVLDGEQAVAISLALQTSPTTVLGLRDAADRALHTLSQVMPAPMRAQVDATRVTTIRNYWEFSAPRSRPPSSTPSATPSAAATCCGWRFCGPTAAGPIPATPTSPRRFGSNRTTSYSGPAAGTSSPTPPPRATGPFTASTGSTRTTPPECRSADASFPATTSPPTS